MNVGFGSWFVHRVLFPAGCTDADCVTPSVPREILVRAGLRALGEYQLQLNGPLDGVRCVPLFVILV